ncbi:MAG: nucleoside 2-deoxyribosyltransferase [Nanoarchaeota archaeon]|nr:nucleoside 2-deoxyribosyltransferase [Nanoarchaeota archaeon]
MKIYFAGSIRGGRDDVEIYNQIIQHLKGYGDVLTEHVGHDNLAEGEINLTDKYIHNRDVNWIDECDVFIADVTRPSHGVGYEVRVAIEKKKRILCIYRPKEQKRVSAMIAGAPGIKTSPYNTIEDAKKIIDRFIKDVES